jgi:hypothetical protein
VQQPSQPLVGLLVVLQQLYLLVTSKLLVVVVVERLLEVAVAVEVI